MIFDLSDEFDEESSLDDLNDELFSNYSLESNGFAELKGGMGGSILKYKLNGDSAEITLTGFGKELYKTGINRPIHVDPLAFSHYLGCGASSLEDLKRKCGLLNNENLSSLHVLKMAINDQKINVTKSEKLASGIPMRSVETILKSDVLHLDGAKDSLSCAIKKNIIKHGSARQISTAILRRDRKLVPIVIKSASSTASASIKKSEETMIAMEYAALKALKEHGIKTINVGIVRDDAGSIFMISERFDMEQMDILNETEAGLNYLSRDKAINFISATTQKTTQIGVFTNLHPDEANMYMANIVSGHQESKKQHTVSRIFNCLIGNTDENGSNCGVLKTVSSDGTIKAKLCPLFDISPHLFDGSAQNYAADSKFSGKKLFSMSLEDILKIDAQINNAHQINKELVEDSFRIAVKARDGMIKIINNELVEKRIISKNDANDFNQYLNSYLGNQGGSEKAPKVVSPFSNESKMSSLATKLENAKDTHDIDFKPK
jgi:hypothetical protein